VIGGFGGDDFGDSLETNTALNAPITFEKRGEVDFDFSRAMHARTDKLT